MNETSRRDYNMWVVVRPAEDVQGQWVAHCLEFDVVSQGNSLEHALEMVCEAVAMVVVDDRIAGRDPLERRAPEEFYDGLYALLEHGEKVPTDDLGKLDHECRIVAFATQLSLRIEERKREVTPRLRRVPVAIAQQELACG